MVYNDQASSAWQRFPMCYNAAKGTVFKEIFGIKQLTDIPNIIRSWAALQQGWNTDELVLYAYLTRWSAYKTRCVRLGNRVERRIDRSKWVYHLELVHTRFYRDAHLPRPYQHYKEAIDRLAREYGITTP